MVSVSGVRGIVGKTMTPEVAVRFAGAVGTWLVRRGREGDDHRPPHVLVARDGRWGGEALYHAAIAGLEASGCSVSGHGIAMTPTLGVLLDNAKESAAIQITASHNPQEWNGLKVLLRAHGRGGKAEHEWMACAPSAGVASEIIDIFKRNEIVWGHRERSDDREWPNEYDEATFDHAIFHESTVRAELEGAWHGAHDAIAERWYRVVLDHCNASGQMVTPRLLRNLRCAAMLNNGTLDIDPRDSVIRPVAPSGIFPHTPEPTEANLTELAAEVKKHKADVGFAQDPDADRLAIIDENGKYIGEEYTLVLAAMALAEFGVVKHGSVIAVNLSTSRMIEDVAAKYGASVVRTAVGEANVVEAMKKLGPEKCPLGGEGNGGVIWPRVTYVRDSLSGMALVLALMAKTGKTVSQLVSTVPSYAIVKRKVDLKDRSEADRAAAAVKGHFKGARIDTQDGVRVDIDDATYGKAWLHVRASNTEPIMRLIAEAPTKGQAEKLLDEAAKVIG